MSLLRCISQRGLQIVTSISRQHRSVIPHRNLKRWVAPTLIELNKRRNKIGEEAPTPRSTFVEWNYDAELYAFGRRLNEDFNGKLLRQALTHRSFVIQEEMKQREVGIEDPIIDIKDNRNLMAKGDDLIRNYLTEFLGVHLPNLPADGIKSVINYLTSTELLAYISSHIGCKDIVLCSEFPVGNEILAGTLKAVIGALEESSGIERANSFIRDFICTILNQKDIGDLWTIEKPMEKLREYCESKKLMSPEPRLLGNCGTNTILAAYHVGIYCNKIQMGTGYGESIEIAIQTAASNALHKIYGIKNMKPFNFNLELTLNNKADAVKANIK